MRSVHNFVLVFCLFLVDMYIVALSAEGDGDIKIVMVNNSRYTTSLHVAKYYLGEIIGNGSVKSRIENDTSTYIKIPPQREGNRNITIFGSKPTDVVAASRLINQLVIASRLRQNTTHFIAIPMNGPDIIKKFKEFKTAVLRECAACRGVDETLFNNPAKLHITVGVMSLMDDEEVLHVSKLLNDAKHKVVLPLLERHLPLKIRLKGLSYWSRMKNNDPTDIRVLFGTVQEEGDVKGLVQQLADGLVDYFHKAGYMNREYDNVALHVTLMNSKLRPTSFDGSEVLKKFADYDFGVMELKNIHLLKRSSMGPDGFYQSEMIASITC